MKKSAFYFSHDYYARMDPKLIDVQQKLGMEGIGIYWCIVEMLYENNGYLELEYERISYVLRSDSERIRSIINDFQLFTINDVFFFSKTILERLKLREEKSLKASKSIKTRWTGENKDTNVLRDEYERTSVKESKGKGKNKEKEIDVDNSPYQSLKKQILELREE